MYSYRIPGTAIPQGSKSVTKTGLMFDSNKNLKAWRNHATETIAKQHPLEHPILGALAADIHIYLPKPKTVTRNYPSVKPDIDKLARAILDSLTAAGAIKDDSLICELHISKTYTTLNPKVLIKIWSLEETE